MADMVLARSIDDVTVWTSSLDDALLLDARDALSVAELQRAEKISHGADRDRFLAGRSLLRHALSRAPRSTLQDGVPEDRWRFVTNGYGKPLVAAGLPRVSFNLAHAGRCVVVAVGPDRAVGVDVEPVVRDARSEIVEDCLTVREREHLGGVSDVCRWDTFLEYWTAKEACAKAVGLGVALPFNEIDVTLGTRPTAEILNDDLPATVISLSIFSIACDAETYRLSLASLA